MSRPDSHCLSQAPAPMRPAVAPSLSAAHCQGQPRGAASDVETPLDWVHRIIEEERNTVISSCPLKGHGATDEQPISSLAFIWRQVSRLMIGPSLPLAIWGRAASATIRPRLTIGSQLRFGMNSCATPAPTVRSRRCLPIVWLLPASKRSALSLS
jgi:hypothetical protein